MNKNTIVKILLPLVIITSLSLIIAAGANAARKITTLNRVSPSLEEKILFDEKIRFEFINLREEDKSKINIAISPFVNNELLWEGSTLIFSHNVFTPGEIYIADVYFNEELVTSFDIEVKSIDEMSESELTSYQAKNRELLNDNEQTKKWLVNLPYFSNEYSIIYDYENEVIRIRIPNQKTDAETDRIKENVVIKLASFGVTPSENVIFILD